MKGLLYSKGSRQRRGVAMLEVLLAVAFFGIAGTALMVALNQVGILSSDLANDRRLSRILDSEIRRVLSIPEVTEGTTTRALSELGVELETVIEEMELENQDGELLNSMFRIVVSANWWAEGDWQRKEAETWRYARLYQ